MNQHLTRVGIGAAFGFKVHARGASVPEAPPAPPAVDPDTHPDAPAARPERKPDLDPFNPAWPPGRQEPQPKA